MTLKIQGQGHGWGQSSKSQCDSNIPSTHILLVSTIPFLRYSIFKIWPWKSKVKVIAQGHKVDITPYLLISLSFHVDQPSHSWDTAISKFDIENSWVRSTFSRLTSLSFHVNWASHFWVRTFSKFERENQCHWRGRSSISHNVGLTSYQLTSLSFHVNRPSRDTAFLKFDLEKIQGQGQMTMKLHNCRSRQFHKTLNGINPSCGFRDLSSAKSGPSAAWFEFFFNHWQAHMGQMGK